MQVTAAERIQSLQPKLKADRLLWIRLSFWVFALIAGACQAWVSRDVIATDGISYLDMSDAVLKHDWSRLINGYWGPLYPLLLGIARAVLRTSAEHEFAVVHLVNFAIYLFAAFAFEFLLRGLLAHGNPSSGRRERLPDAFIASAAYCLFLWTTLGLITLSVSSPDLAVAGFLFLAAGFAVRIASGAESWIYPVALGLSLGIGYFAKAPLFLLAFAFLATVLLGGTLRARLPKLTLAFAAFALSASILIVPLSLKQHHLTFSDSGLLNYAWYVDGATYRHWQGEALGTIPGPAPKFPVASTSSGTPLHPTRRVLVNPPVFEFNGPVEGTYPVWFDPSYWNAGVKTTFNLRQQMRKLAINGKFMYGLLLNLHVSQLFRSGRLAWAFSPIFVAVLLFLFYLEWRAGFSSRGLSVAATLLVPAAAGFAMYSLVYCEPRHLAGIAALLYLGLLLAIRLPQDQASQCTRALAVLLCGFVLTVGLGTAATVYDATRQPHAEDWNVASALQNMGVAQGAKVASLEYSNHRNVKWARLLRARIVAEIYTGTVNPNEKRYWDADPEVQSRVLREFSKAGAEFVVAREVPSTDPSPAGWEPVGKTGYSLYRLNTAATAKLDSK